MPLTTYKASAGSGKTYTITREYLRWLLSSPSNKTYRHILAVTFTNKATDEMKKRIVGALDKLAEGKDKALESEFCTSLSISPDKLRERAMQLRAAILHDYAHFAVSTIDKFFQKILHAFVREAGLLPGFTLELDQERLLDEAIDSLLRDMNAEPLLCQWLSDLIESRIESGKTWDVRTQLKEMGGEVFKERFRRLEKEFTGKLSDKNFLTSYAKTLQDIIVGFEQAMQQYGKEALQLLAKHGLVTGDFKYGKTSFANYFNKLFAKSDYEPGKRTIEAQNEVEKWYGSNKHLHAQIDAVFPFLNNLLVQAVEYYEKYYVRYHSVCMVWRNFYSMGLLADMAMKVRSIASDENLLPISDSLLLLQALIGDHDTPFVYEKTGTRYRSFMLDEFQDTSSMQWHNLRPLLHNGLAEGGDALVVGDVKQSIYRWRNGDWRILAYRLQDDFKIFHPKSVALDTNWRSKPEIIRVNNDLFTHIPALLQARLNSELDESGAANEEQKQALRSMICDAYTDAVQQVSPPQQGKGGYVEIVQLTDDEDFTAKEKSLQRLPALIAELQERGYRASDIAVLVRVGREGQEVANTLLQYKQSSNDTQHCFDVVSQDSLFLHKAPVVHLVMAVLRQTVRPDDAINNALIAKYCKEKMMEVPSDLPLLEAFEFILQQYKLTSDSRNIPFLQELHDCMMQFATRNTSDIYSFLDWWEQQGAKKTISENEQQEAIRILTIHKSKGLQFRVVIVPFCAWRIEPKANSLVWLSSAEAPLNELPFFPLNYSSKLSQTFFQHDYLTEKAQSYVDNLNLLYVAFTRAEEELYAFVPQPARKSGYALSDLLPEALQSEHFTAGVKEQAAPPALAGNISHNITLTTYPSHPVSSRLRMKYSGDITEETHRQRDFGILMHRAFSMIATPHDIPQAVRQLVDGGFLENDEKRINELASSMAEAIGRPQVAEWFDGSWQLRNEADILLPAHNGQFVQYRPDRVMMREDEVIVVDYKFGDKKMEHYMEQVQNYLHTLSKMNYRNVRGYIWYVMLNEVIEVHI